MAQEHIFPTLYTLTSKKATRYWRIKACVDDKGIASYYREYGQVGVGMETTKLQNFIPEAKSKETPYQQAIFDAQSKWDDMKNKKGYVEDINKLNNTVTQLTASSRIKLKPKSAIKDEKYPSPIKLKLKLGVKDEKQPSLTPSGKIRVNMKQPSNNNQDYAKYESFKFLPMLANKYTERKHNIKYPCCVQPKLDGVRYTARMKQDKSVLMSSRNDEPALYFNEVKAAIFDLKLDAGVFLDGELYSLKIPFKTLNGYCNRKKLDGKTGYSKIPKDELESIHYYIFDCYFADQPDKSFEQRHKYLQELLSKNQSKYVKLVECKTHENETSIMQEHDKCVQEGYEGVMVRNFDSKYTLKNRSSDLLKYKVFDDSEFSIVGAECSHDNKQQGCIIWILGVPGTDLTFTCRPRDSDDNRREDWNNYCNDSSHYIGKKYTVRYQGKYDNGRPRFPVGIAIRWDL